MDNAPEDAGLEEQMALYLQAQRFETVEVGQVVQLKPRIEISSQSLWGGMIGVVTELYSPVSKNEQERIWTITFSYWVNGQRTRSTQIIQESDLVVIGWARYEV